MKNAIVLGGTFDHIRLIQILKEKDYVVTLIDYLENPPAKLYAENYIRESTLDKEKVLEISLIIKPQIVIAACIDQALVTMAYVCEKLELPCHISYQTALELTNKEFMKQRFAENQICSSPFCILNSSLDLSTIQLLYPLVVKPPDSNSSKGIEKVIEKSELKAAFERALKQSRSQNVIIEEFIEGEELSVDVIIDNYEPTILMVTKNIKIKQNKKNFTIVQSYYSGMPNELIIDELKTIAKKIAHAFNIQNSTLLIQLIKSHDKLYVIEFSARIGGGSKHQFIQRVSGCDILDFYVCLVEGSIKPVQTLDTKIKHASIIYLYAYPDNFSRFEGFEELMNAGIIEQSYYFMTEGNEIKSNIASNDRPAGFLVIADSYNDLNEKIAQADKSLKIINNNGQDIMIHGICN